jgi:hypothetical protein
MVEESIYVTTDYKPNTIDICSRPDTVLCFVDIGGIVNHHCLSIPS